ncbi:glutaredoxin domain-containing protein [Nocardia asteroides]|uniref:glutaredoxin domain-containing protein n=1 Tax=Nocardia asteroides TaxID=1824 RepID=UPI0033EA60E6
MPNSSDAVVVYTRPGCPFSMKLRWKMRLARLRYTERDIWQDPDAAAYVRSVAHGNETVPTVTVAGHALVNPTLREVLSAVRRYAPGASPGR